MKLLRFLGSLGLLLNLATLAMAAVATPGLTPTVSGTPLATPTPSVYILRLSASGPTLASGLPLHSSTLDLTILDAGLQPISGLTAGDFQIDISGTGNFPDWSVFAETPPGSGTYRLLLASSTAEAKLLAVWVRGVLATPASGLGAPGLVFVPGVYGQVLDAISRQPLAGMQIAWVLTGGTPTTANVSDAQGWYSLLQPAPRSNSTAFLLTASDPLGNYQSQQASVDIPPQTAIRRDLFLAPFPVSGSLDGRVYPVPAPRGSALTVEFSLPHPGQLRLELFDLRGRRVALLTRGGQPAGRGRLRWIAANSYGQELAPGTYRLVFRLDDLSLVRKVVIVP